MYMMMSLLLMVLTSMMLLMTHMCSEYAVCREAYIWRIAIHDVMCSSEEGMMVCSLVVSTLGICVWWSRCVSSYQRMTIAAKTDSNYTVHNSAINQQHIRTRNAHRYTQQTHQTKCAKQPSQLVSCPLDRKSSIHVRLITKSTCLLKKQHELSKKRDTTDIVSNHSRLVTCVICARAIVRVPGFSMNWDIATTELFAAFARLNTVASFTLRYYAIIIAHVHKSIRIRLKIILFYKSYAARHGWGSAAVLCRCWCLTCVVMVNSAMSCKLWK